MISCRANIFAEQVYATFFNDPVGGKMFSWWGCDNFMWSNDYPHQNSTWPNSRDVIARDMAHLVLRGSGEAAQYQRHRAV